MTQCYWDWLGQNCIPCKCSLVVTLSEVSLKEDSIYLNPGHSEGGKKTIKSSWASQSLLIRDFAMHSSLLVVVSLSACTFPLLAYSYSSSKVWIKSLSLNLIIGSKSEPLALRCALPNTSLGTSLKLAGPVAQNFDFCHFAFNHFSSCFLSYHIKQNLQQYCGGMGGKEDFLETLSPLWQ